MSPAGFSFDLRALRAFAETIRTGSATAAGREMGLTQSAVSRILAQLEAQVGFELFWRDKGRLILTKDGSAFYEEVELALTGMARVESRVRDIAGLASGELRIVAPPSFTQTILPDIAASFLTEHPGVKLNFDSRSVDTARTMIATRVADIGFLKLPVDHPDIHVERVISSGTVCVVHARHPLASHDRITPDELEDEPLIMLGARRDVRASIDQAFRERGKLPRVAIETTTVSSAIALVERGLGTAIVNGLLARGLVGPQVRLLPFEPTISQDYAFAVSALSSPTPLAQEFLLATRQYFGGIAAAP